MQYDDDHTQFDPSPWGSRQRVLPRSTFKAVASVVTQVPEVPSLVARVARSADAANIGAPIVREADIPTWRVPKLPLAPSRRVDLRLWLPIGGLAAIVIIALLGARLAGGIRADATAISAALLGETSDDRFHIVTNVEDPPAPHAIEAPRPIAVAKAKPARARHASSKRPLLAVDVSTPLGDLARERRR